MGRCWQQPAGWGGSAAVQRYRGAKPSLTVSLAVLAVARLRPTRHARSSYFEYLFLNSLIKVGKLFPNLVKVVKRYSGTADGEDEAGPSTSGGSRSPPQSFSDRITGISALISKIQISGQPPPPLVESNPITKFFVIDKQCCFAGAGQLWRVFDAERKRDGKACSIFVVDKRHADKQLRPKRKETLMDVIKEAIENMKTMRIPQVLELIHDVEEGPTNYSFATELIIGTLQDILNYTEFTPLKEDEPLPVMPHPISLSPPTAQNIQRRPSGQRPKFAKDFEFLEVEIRHGVRQIINALYYLHYTQKVVHRNVCPETIIITMRGSWKLFGFEFLEPASVADPTDNVPVMPWSIKLPKGYQPNLDYIAPEVINGQCNILSDMFSLGLVICAVFNHGHPIVRANNMPTLYMKQIECLDQQVDALQQHIPELLLEAVQRMLSRDPHPRPTALLLPMIKYFQCNNDPTIQALHFLDGIEGKIFYQIFDFFQETLPEALPHIPKKLRWKIIWPALVAQFKIRPMHEALVLPLIWLAEDATPEDFQTKVIPIIQGMSKPPKTQATICAFLENLHRLIPLVNSAEQMRNVLFPVLYYALDSNLLPIQISSIHCLKNCSDFVDDNFLHSCFIKKLRLVIEKNYKEIEIIMPALAFFKHILPRMDDLDNEILPSMYAMKLIDPDVVFEVVSLTRTMYDDPKYKMTVFMMATEIIPYLAPSTVNPFLTVSQFSSVMKIIYEMLENIDSCQRPNLLIEKEKPTLEMSPERRALFMNNVTIDKTQEPPPFSIPNLRVDSRKTDSYEEVARKNSATNAAPVQPQLPTSAATSAGSVTSAFKNTGIGQWMFGSKESTGNDNNFLRVTNVFQNRRLSDNTLMTPKIRIAPSSNSSPGGTPGGSSGLPSRRHSSIGAQERRKSAVNLSPPIAAYQRRGRGGSGSSLSVPIPRVGGSMPNTSSSSAPYLTSSSMNSFRSRRPSGAQTLQARREEGFFKNLSVGMQQLLSGRT